MEANLVLLCKQEEGVVEFQSCLGKTSNLLKIQRSWGSILGNTKKKGTTRS